MAASLFVHHPYGIPIIGWMHEIEALDRTHALDYYGRFLHARETAILVVAGDVTPEERAAPGRRHLRPGRATRRPPSGAPASAGAPSPRAMRRVAVADPRVEQPTLQAALSRALGHDRHDARERRAGGAGRAPRRRADLVFLPHAGAGQGGGGERRRPGTWRPAIDETRFAVYLVPRPRREPRGRPREALDAAIRAIPDAALSDAAITPRQEPASSPRRSTPPTSQPRSRASSARRSPSARRSRTCGAGRPTWRPSPARTWREACEARPRPRTAPSPASCAKSSLDPTRRGKALHVDRRHPRHRPARAGRPASSRPPGSRSGTSNSHVVPLVALSFHFVEGGAAQGPGKARPASPR